MMNQSPAISAEWWVVSPVDVLLINVKLRLERCLFPTLDLGPNPRMSLPTLPAPSVEPGAPAPTPNPKKIIIK